MDRYVFCIKWGNRYSSTYVERLYRMVQKFTKHPVRFVCLTDDPESIPIETRNLICTCDFQSGLEYSWTKVALVSPKHNPFQGVGLFLDLDVVIIDDIDCFFEYKPHLESVSNIEWRPIGRTYPVYNNSIWRIHSGWGTHLYTDLMEALESGRLTDVSTEKDGYVKRKYQDSDGEILAQRHWVSKYGHPEAFPIEWCASYRYQCQEEIPEGTKIVVFHGLPKPHQIQNQGWQDRWQCVDSFQML